MSTPSTRQKRPLNAEIAQASRLRCDAISMSLELQTSSSTTVTFEPSGNGWRFFNESTRKYYPATSDDVVMLQAMIDGGMSDAFEIWCGDVDPVGAN